MRLGDLDALYDHVMEEMRRNPHCGRIEKIMHRHEHEAFLRDIRLAPTIDAVPVAHGQWIEKPFLLGTSNFCSLCDSFYGMPHGKFNYCPNCGARMDGDSDEG